MTKTFSEEAIRKIVRDEIMLLGLPGGLTTIISTCMMVVRWAQKTKRKLERQQQKRS